MIQNCLYVNNYVSTTGSTDSNGRSISFFQFVGVLHSYYYSSFLLALYSTKLLRSDSGFETNTFLKKKDSHGW